MLLKLILMLMELNYGTNIINGINLNFNSNSVNGGTGTYTGISSQGNSDNNELFTAGYFKATANNNGQAVSLHTDGKVKMENIDLDDENSTKSLFLNSNNEVVYKNKNHQVSVMCFTKKVLTSQVKCQLDGVHLQTLHIISRDDILF